VLLLTDPAKARELARQAMAFYLPLTNYRANWLRLGFSDQDLANEGRRPVSRRHGRPGQRSGDPTTHSGPFGRRGEPCLRSAPPPERRTFAGLQCADRARLLAEFRREDEERVRCRRRSCARYRYGEKIAKPWFRSETGQRHQWSTQAIGDDSEAQPQTPTVRRKCTGCTPHRARRSRAVAGPVDAPDSVGPADRDR
jgi:hypothetical protein